MIRYRISIFLSQTSQRCGTATKSPLKARVRAVFSRMHGAVGRRSPHRRSGVVFLPTGLFSHDFVMHAVLVVPLLAARPAEVWRRRAKGRRFRRRKRFPAHVAVDEARVIAAADSCCRGFPRILAEVLFFAHAFRRRIKRFLKRRSLFRLRAALAAAVPSPDIVARLAARRFPWRTARGRGLRVPFVCSTPGEASCCALPGANGPASPSSGSGRVDLPCVPFPRAWTPGHGYHGRRPLGSAPPPERPRLSARPLPEVFPCARRRVRARVCPQLSGQGAACSFLRRFF